VAYDDSGGCFAARAWWLFHHFGHGNALVLDGGWQAWCAAGGASLSGPADSAAAASPTTAPGVAVVAPAPAIAGATGAIVSRSELPGKLLVDARDPGRYAGEMEPIDARAGHIPGAYNRFWRLNLDAEGRFLPPGELRSAWLTLLGDTPPEEVVCYCGSGVTACHNLLALAHAGIDGARLYPGSWSEYSADPARPVATGLEPGGPLQAG
jgi:thiosulfate/3-mercaptopyruvate sulfurtransferase